MAAPNLFQELQNVLTEFNEFLTQHRGTIKPAIAPLDQLTGGRATELIDALIDLMGKLKNEINQLDPNIVPGLAEVTEFTESVKTLLETSKGLLPDEADTIDDILDVADIVTGLPSVADLKTALIGLIEDIIGHLNFLKA